MKETFDVNGHKFEAHIRDEVVIKYSGSVTIKGITLVTDDDCEDEQDAIDSLKEAILQRFPEFSEPADGENGDANATIVPHWMHIGESATAQLKRWNEGAAATSTKPYQEIRFMPILQENQQP